MEKQTPKPRKAIERFGVERAQKVVLEILKGLSEKYPDSYFPSATIQDLAACKVFTDAPQNFRYATDARTIFNPENMKAMLRERGSLDEYVERVKSVSVIPYTYEIDTGTRVQENYIYRLKQTQGDIKFIKQP